MKIKFFAAYASIFISFSCFSQTDKIPWKIIEKANLIVELVKQDRISELASLVKYPLWMPDPIPDIESAKEFAKYYPILFDSSFKQKFFNYGLSDIWQDKVTLGYAMFNGEISFESNGKIDIYSFNSLEQKKLVQKLSKELLIKMHPSIKAWKENVLVCKTDKYYIRIDYTEDGYRYISWASGKQISDKPDLILYNGEAEAQGSIGGFTYTFINEDWTYVIDDVNACETKDKCGLFLRILFKGKVKNNFRCQKLK